MKPLQHASTETQGSAEWKQERAGSVTGSGFAKLLTKARTAGAESKVRQSYRLQLLTERVTGIPAPEVEAAALAWGKDNEERARIAYEMYMHSHGQQVYVERVGFQQHAELEWVGSSPDGLVGEHGMIEIKCPYNSANHLLTLINASARLAAALAMANEMPITIAVPEEHLPQIQGNLWVLNREWCDFVSYDPRVPEHLQLYVTRIERDPAFIAKLEAEVMKFLDEIESNMGVLLAPEENFPQPVVKGA